MLERAKAFDDAVDRCLDPLRGRPVADWVFYAASEAADYSKAWHVIGAGVALVSPSRRRHAMRLAVALGVGIEHDEPDRRMTSAVQRVTTDLVSGQILRQALP